MADRLQSLVDIAADYDAIVLDQWGVLHDGSTPYAGAIDALSALQQSGHTLAVLSNSGKRAEPNAERIKSMGFSAHQFAQVMTSGEALWQDIHLGVIAKQAFYCLERNPGDASDWACGLSVDLCDSIDDADAVLLMGLPDNVAPSYKRRELDAAMQRALPMYCSNPDKASPRADGNIVTSPGTLAYQYQTDGGEVIFYGKPYKPVFTALQSSLNAEKLLMVGDSLDHDIAGAHAASWHSVFITNGLHAADFSHANTEDVLAQLCDTKKVLPPTFVMNQLN